ncbi:MAG: SulP family inorganic anion transporter [Nannocystales bacterium]
MSLLRRLVPAATWLRSYERADLQSDLSAGLTTAVMLIPQGMAYAMLAGLPPIIGLYASTIPIVLYALFGSSRQLAVGPVAMVSLLVATALTPLAEAGSTEYVGYAVALALLVGLIQAVMGLLRAGFLVNFLSHPVVSGFTSAAALIIGLSQLGHLLGVNIPRSHHIHTIILGAIDRVAEVQPSTVLIGAVSIAVLVALKRRAPKLPRALIVVVGGTLVVWGFDLASSGVAIVGEVPAGLPAPTLPVFGGDTLASLLPTAVIISLVGFMESVSVAKAFASRNRYEIEPNQELVGLGLANLGAAVFGGYPVTGGFSRTAVNAQAGARTPLAGLVTALVVMGTLLFLTPLFYFLPKAVLAAVIMTAVFGLIDVAEVRHLWAVDRADLALLVLTFVGTLALGIEAGIGLGVAASLLWFVVQTSRPHAAVLGRIPGTTSYRNVLRNPAAQQVRGVLILRMDASFYFGNVTFLKEMIRDSVAVAEERPSTVILDASSINRLDSSANAAMSDIVRSLADQGIRFVLAGLKGPVLDALRRSGLDTEVVGASPHLSVHDAVVALESDPPQTEPAVQAGMRTAS